MEIVEAKKRLEEDKINRMEMCRKELEEILAKHNCRIDVSMMITSSGIFPKISILAN